MENRIFVLFFIIAALSFLFTGSSMLILHLRSKYSLRVLPILWSLLFLIALIPIDNGKNAVELVLFQNYTGGLRIELHPTAEDDTAEDPPEFYIPYPILRGVRIACGLLLLLWFVCATASFTFGLASYFDGMHYLTRHSAECREERVNQIFAAAKKKAGLRRNVSLRIMRPGLRISPCTCGILYPCVYLGGDYPNECSDLQLEMIFLHELTHIRHLDTLTKLLTLLATSFHALLPTARGIRRAVCEDLEYLCDEAVLDKIGDYLCGEYMAVLLYVTERNLREDCQGAEILSCLSQSGSALLKRYENMKNRHDKKRNVVRTAPALLAGAALNLLLMSAVGIRSVDNLGVDLVNPLVEAALCEYFMLDDVHDLTQNHLNQIYSIEFSLSEELELPGVEAEASYALACTFNEGFLWTGSESVPVFDPVNGARHSFEILPHVLRGNQFVRRIPASLRSFYHPYAEADCSVYLLDPYLSDEEAVGLINVQYRLGLLECFLTDSREIDTRDIALFGALRTVIFSDWTESSRKEIYETTRFAVISRGR